MDSKALIEIYLKIYLIDLSNRDLSNRDLSFYYNRKI